MSQCPKCMHSAKTVLDDVDVACKRIVHDSPDRADCSVTNDMWRRWKGENREEGKLVAALEGPAEEVQTEPGKPEPVAPATSSSDAESIAENQSGNGEPEQPEE